MRYNRTSQILQVIMDPVPFRCITASTANAKNTRHFIGRDTFSVFSYRPKDIVTVQNPLFFKLLLCFISYFSRHFFFQIHISELFTYVLSDSFRTMVQKYGGSECLHPQLN